VIVGCKCPIEWNQTNPENIRSTKRTRKPDSRFQISQPKISKIQKKLTFPSSNLTGEKQMKQDLPSHYGEEDK